MMMSIASVVWLHGMAMDDGTSNDPTKLIPILDEVENVKVAVVGIFSLALDSPCLTFA